MFLPCLNSKLIELQFDYLMIARSTSGFALWPVIQSFFFIKIENVFYLSFCYLLLYTVVAISNVVDGMPITIHSFCNGQKRRRNFSVVGRTQNKIGLGKKSLNKICAIKNEPNWLVIFCID